ENLFKITRPEDRDVPIITIELELEDGDQAAKLVDRLMELNIKQLVDQRKKAFARDIEDLEVSLTKQRKDLESASKELEKFLAFHKDRNPKVESDEVNKEIAKADAELAQRKTAKSGHEKVIESLERQIEKFEKSKAERKENVAGEPDRDEEERQRQKRD